MPGFPLGLAGHVTMTKSHGFLVYIDIHGLLSATSPGGAVGQSGLRILCRAFPGDFELKQSHSKDTREDSN